MKETEKIRVMVLFNELKYSLQMSLDNELYQEWTKTDKKVKFRNWIIDKFKGKIDECDVE